jgi:hypothetical protein
MGNDLVPDEHVQRLKMICTYSTNDLDFKNAKRMGNVLTAAFDLSLETIKNPI